MARFILATVPLTGHVVPGLPIARALVRQGHSVWWYGGARFRPQIEATGAHFLPMQAAYDYDDSDIEAAFPALRGLTGLARVKMQTRLFFVEAMRGQAADLRQAVAELHPDVLLGDASFRGGELVSEQTGVPWASFNISCLLADSRDSTIGSLPNASLLGQLRNLAFNRGLIPLLFGDVNACYNQVRRDAGLPPRPGTFFYHLSPFLHMQPTVPAFEYPRRDLPRQVHFIGPLLPEAHTDFAPPLWWPELQGCRPVVLVTQGTLATDPSQLLAATLRALAADDVLVVATTGGRPVEGLGLLPANARVVPFIPYRHLLPRVRVMVTNGGYGGVQQALAHGVPLVVAGGSEEKPEIANRVGWAGAGINLRTGTPSPARIRQAVHAVLARPGYRQQAQRLATEFAAYDAPTAAVGLLERLAATQRPVYQ
ncbi:MAG: hypothetical protein MUD01_17960 [Chloroflexaceae bacterium]|jgi:MGT family glycosyltransferase|nr:hypothetical protein [Chloroflexaceae bacterium]